MDRIQVFERLTKKLPAYLQKLERNNSREWFNAHRDEYQHYVAGPLAALAEMLAPGMALLDNSIVKKLSRPYRDTRFAKDKLPYRTEMWFAFRRAQPDWVEYPAFFFEATPEHCRWGMGFYSARPATMSALRSIVHKNQNRYLTAMAAAAGRGFSLHGDLYKRYPSIPANTPEEIAELTRRRNVYLCRMMGYDEPLLLSSELASVLAADFASLGAMYRLFCTAVERQGLTF